MPRTALLAALAALSAVAPGAHAATVSVRYETVIEPKMAPTRHGAIVVTAAPGEANVVSLAPEAQLPRVVVVRDNGAVLTAGDGCRAGSDGAVRCESETSFLAKVAVDLGDGDDRLDATSLAVPVTATGGAGNDALAGGSGADGLDGGDGSDRVEGGVGADSLQGGTGSDEVLGGSYDDTLRGDPPDATTFGADRLYGGDGSKDVVSYDGRTVPVTVDLADAGDDGVPGEGDSITGAELLNGGEGGDSLTGGDAADTIRGGGGADRIAGGAGFDELFGEAGDDELRGGRTRDVLEGGAGDDRLDGEQGDDTLKGAEGADELIGGTGSDIIDARDGELSGDRPVRDPVIDCGAGPGDRVYRPRAPERVGPDCEAVGILRSFDLDVTANVSSAPRRTRRGLLVRSSCKSEGRCTGRAVIRDASSGRLLATGDGSGSEGFDIRLRPTRAAALTGRPRALRMAVRVEADRVPVTVSFVFDPEL